MNFFTQKVLLKEAVFLGKKMFDKNLKVLSIKRNDVFFGSLLMELNVPVEIDKMGQNFIGSCFSDIPLAFKTKQIETERTKLSIYPGQVFNLNGNLRIANVEHHIDAHNTLIVGKVVNQSGLDLIEEIRKNEKMENYKMQVRTLKEEVGKSIIQLGLLTGILFYGFKTTLFT